MSKVIFKRGIIRRGAKGEVTKFVIEHWLFCFLECKWNTQIFACFTYAGYCLSASFSWNCNSGLKKIKIVFMSPLLV